jgi:hypothetical protein
MRASQSISESCCMQSALWVHDRFEVSEERGSVRGPGARSLQIPSLTKSCTIIHKKLYAQTKPIRIQRRAGTPQPKANMSTAKTCVPTMAQNNFGAGMGGFQNSPGVLVRNNIRCLPTTVGLGTAANGPASRIRIGLDATGCHSVVQSGIRRACDRDCRPRWLGLLE